MRPVLALVGSEKNFYYFTGTTGSGQYELSVAGDVAMLLLGAGGTQQKLNDFFFPTRTGKGYWGFFSPARLMSRLAVLLGLMIESLED